MAVNPDDYLAGFGGGGATTVGAAPRIIDTNDTGRGPGTRGSRGPGLTGVQVAAPLTQFGDEDVTKLLKGLPPERISAIQQRMQTVGLLPKEFKSFGFVENTTRSGFTELLQVANDRGESNWENTLDLLIAGQSGDGSVAGATTLGEERVRRASRRQQAMLSFDTKLNTYEKSDPAGVRQTAEQAFQQALGRKPRKDEMERFVTGFLGRERGEQARVFGAQDRLEAGQRGRTLQSLDLDEQQAAAESGGGAVQGGESAELSKRVDALIAASPYGIKAGAKTRDYETQVRLYNNYINGKGPRAAKPGTSKHGDGRANDLQYSSDKARQWALANAGKFGLHFPIYDQKLARGRDESWHVELKAGEYEGLNSPPPGAAAGAVAGGGMAPVSENITVQRQDLGAQAVEYARNVNPTETKAYDIGGQFNSLMQILQKGVI